MKRFIEGADRNQAMLLPECLDDFVSDDNRVRAVDAFISSLDLGGLGSPWENGYIESFNARMRDELLGLMEQAHQVILSLWCRYSLRLALEAIRLAAWPH